MGLIERIKSVLGFGTSATPSQPATGRDHPSPDETETSDPEPASGGEDDDRRASTETASDSGDSSGTVDVTVEHDPDDGTGADERSATGGAEPDTEAEEAVKGAETDAGTDADLEEIKGIGPTYADRLHEAGVENVADLATADAAEVADASGIGQSRVQKWIDRAETY